MRREDLFVAIGAAEDKHLAQCEKSRNPSQVIPWEEPFMQNKKRETNLHRKHRIWLIAAIVVLMLLMMGSAIATIVTMQAEEVKLFVHTAENPSGEQITSGEVNEEATFETKGVYEGEKISFNEVQDVFIELGSYYPQEIPDGYTMTFVSNDAPLQNQVIHYENDAGNMIKYWIYVGDPASSIEIYGIENKTNVSINGQPGILYEQKGSSRMLVWVNKTQGYGFAILVHDDAVDILAMAESTAEGKPLVPSRTEETLKALEEMGDYTPAYLPDGFTELNVLGSPLAEGGWYSYVRKWYINRAENTSIYFEYETYVIMTDVGYTDDAKTACSLFIPGYYILKGKVVGQETEVNGMFAIMTDKDIAWADPETHRVYHLHSEDVTGTELLKVAQSISDSP